jgi:hypothetical protein
MQRECHVSKSPARAAPAVPSTPRRLPRPTRQHPRLPCGLTCGASMRPSKYPGSRSSTTAARHQNASSSPRNSMKVAATKFRPCAVEQGGRERCAGAEGDGEGRHAVSRPSRQGWQRPALPASPTASLCPRPRRRRRRRLPAATHPQTPPPLFRLAVPDSRVAARVRPQDAPSPPFLPLSSPGSTRLARCGARTPPGCAAACRARRGP